MKKTMAWIGAALIALAVGCGGAQKQPPAQPEGAQPANPSGDTTTPPPANPCQPK